VPHWLLFCVSEMHMQRVEVVLHQGLSQELQLRAYLHASHLACTLNQVCSLPHSPHPPAARFHSKRTNGVALRL
jgi:hypothetical protein